MLLKQFLKMGQCPASYAILYVPRIASYTYDCEPKPLFQMPPCDWRAIQILQMFFYVSCMPQPCILYKECRLCMNSCSPLLGPGSHTRSCRRIWSPTVFQLEACEFQTDWALTHKFKQIVLLSHAFPPTRVCLQQMLHLDRLVWGCPKILISMTDSIFASVRYTTLHSSTCSVCGLNSMNFEKENAHNWPCGPWIRYRQVSLPPLGIMAKWFNFGCCTKKAVFIHCSVGEWRCNSSWQC